MTEVDEANAGAPRRGVRPWAFAAGGVVLASLVAGVGGLAYAASHLERVVSWGRVKRELDARHMSVTMASGHVGLSGAELRDLRVVLTKARKNAPVTTIVLPLFRVDASLLGLAFASSKRVERVVAEGLDVHALRFVRDDDDPAKGTDDADDEDEETAPPEVAKALVGLGRAGVELGAFDGSVARVVTEERSLTTGAVTRVEVTGIEAHASLLGGTLAAHLARPGGEPLAITARRSVTKDKEKSEGGAQVGLGADLTIAPGGVVDSRVDVELVDQDLEPRAPRKAKLLSAKVHAAANAAAGEVAVGPLTFEALNGLVVGDARAVQRDTPKGSVIEVPSASARVHVARAPELLATSLASRVELSDAEPLEIKAKALRAGSGASLGEDSEVTLAGAVRRLRARIGEEPLIVEGLETGGRIGFLADATPTGELRVSLGRLEAPGGAHAEGLRVTVGAKPAATGTTGAPSDDKGASNDAPKDAGSGRTAKALAAVDLAAHVELRRATLGNRQLEGVRADAAARLEGTVLHATSAAVTIDRAAAEGAVVERASMRFTPPAAIDVAAKPPLAEVGTGVELSVARVRHGAVHADGLSAQVRVDGASNAARASMAAQLASVSVPGAGGRAATSPVTLAFETGAPMDLFAPERALPPVRGRVEAFGTKVAFEADPEGKTAARVKLSAEAPSLAGVAAFVPTKGPTLCAKSLGRASFAFHAEGRASASELPPGSVRLENVRVCGAPSAVAVDGVDASWEALRQGGEARGGLKLAGLRLGDEQAPRSLDLHARGRRTGPHGGDLALDLTGERVPELHLAASLGFAPREKKLAFGAQVRAAHLEALPLALRTQGENALDALEAIELHAEGNAVGLVDRWDDAGLALAPAAFTNSTGLVDLALSVAKLRARGEKGATLALGRFAAKGTAQKVGKSVSVRATLEADALDADVQGRGASLDGARVSLELASPDGEKLDARARVDVADVTARGKQRVSLGKVAFATDAQGSRSEAIAITRLELGSTGLGTTFSATGSLDLRPRTAPVGVGDVVVVGRESAFLRGVLTADLAALTSSVQGLGARGRVRAPIVLAAGDRSLVRVDGTVELSGVSVDWQGGAIEGLEGRVPIDEEIRFEGDEARLVPSATNAFARERFEDQQPLVADASFVRVKRIAVGETSFGPLGASVRVDRNAIALDRLELGAFGGSVGGRVFVDVRGADTRVDFRGDVTGLAFAEDGKPFDAHMALRLRPWRRALEGRIDVARTSPDQLRLALDVYDPYQENVSANRARQALALGYPKGVRMRFQDGLASIAIDLGGLGAAVRIDEIRGVPIAPMLEKSLSPKLPKDPPRL
jgi:hypothetical protein